MALDVLYCNSVLELNIFYLLLNRTVKEGLLVVTKENKREIRDVFQEGLSLHKRRPSSSSGNANKIAKARVKRKEGE